MAMLVSEIREWLDTLQPGAKVGIDEGALILQEVGGAAYIEIGGLPEDRNAQLDPKEER